MSGPLPAISLGPTTAQFCNYPDGSDEIPKADAIDCLKNCAETGVIRVDRPVRASASESPRIREQPHQFLGAIGRAEDAEAFGQPGHKVPGCRCRNEATALGLR